MYTDQCHYVLWLHYVYGFMMAMEWVVLPIIFHINYIQPLDFNCYFVIIITNYIINYYHHMIPMAQPDILDLDINMIIRENPDERSNTKTYDT